MNSDEQNCEVDKCKGRDEQSTAFSQVEYTVDDNSDLFDGIEDEDFIAFLLHLKFVVGQQFLSG